MSCQLLPPHLDTSMASMGNTNKEMLYSSTFILTFICAHISIKLSQILQNNSDLNLIDIFTDWLHRIIIFSNVLLHNMLTLDKFYMQRRISGPGCSKLTTSLVNDSLKFQTLISQICQYFLLKKCEKLLQCKSFSHFFKKKFQCIWL